MFILTAYNPSTSTDYTLEKQEAQLYWWRQLALR